AAGNTWNAFVDSGGRLRGVRDPLNHLTRFDYDDGCATSACGYSNALTTVTDPLGNVTHFGYDANGNFSSLQDARLHTSNWDYDSMNRVMDRKDPLYPTDSTHIEGFTYDFAGNLQSYTDRTGQLTLAAHDGLNRLQCVKFGAAAGGQACSSADIQYTFDNG